MNCLVEKPWSDRNCKDFVDWPMICSEHHHCFERQILFLLDAYVHLKLTYKHTITYSLSCSGLLDSSVILCSARDLNVASSILAHSSFLMRGLVLSLTLA